MLTVEQLELSSENSPLSVKRHTNKKTVSFNPLVAVRYIPLDEEEDVNKNKPSKALAHLNKLRFSFEETIMGRRSVSVVKVQSSTLTCIRE